MNKRLVAKQLLISSFAVMGIAFGSSLLVNAESSHQSVQKQTQQTNMLKSTGEKLETAENGEGTIGTVHYTFRDGVLVLGGGTITDGSGKLPDNASKIEITGLIHLENDGPRDLFGSMPDLKSITGLENLDTSKATDMAYMFSHDPDLTDLNISTLDTSNVTNMERMFEDDSSLTSVDVSNFKTAKVDQMQGMFWEDPALTSIDVSKFNTENASRMSGMFGRDESLTSLDLSTFDTRKANSGERSDVVNMLSRLSNLTVLRLGPNIEFDSQKKWGKPGLEAPKGEEKWQAINAEIGGTPTNPKGSIFLPNELVDLYDIASPNHPIKVETYVPEGGIPDISVLTVEPTYSIPAGTKFDPSKAFISLTTLDGKIITNYQDALKAGLTVSGDQFDTNTAGTHTVTFNYFDKKSTTQVTVTGSGGGGDGGNVTPTPTPTPSPEVPSNPASPAPRPQPTPTEPTTPSNPPVKPTTPNEAIKHEAVIYAVKGIYLYKHAAFNKAQRIAKYPKQKRIHRPMFIVIDYARSNGGALRYKVRDVNAGTKTVGKVGYITANQKYAQSAYYQTMPKNNRIRVISLKGIHAYKNQNLTGRVKTYKKGTRLTVKKIVKHNLTTRYRLKNGLYITGNKKLIIHVQG